MSADVERKYEVRLRSRRVQKELDDLRGIEYERVVAKLRALAFDPRPRGCEKIFGDIYRIRVGDLRVIYYIEERDRRVDVGAVRRRSEKTYKDIDDLF
jgi:mRNA interferase RelE/StbE